MKALDVKELISSEDELIAFMNSHVWQDMREEIKAWKKGLRDLLEVEKDDDEFHRHQGRTEACTYFLSLPEVLKTDLESIRLLKEKGEKKWEN